MRILGGDRSLVIVRTQGDDKNVTTVIAYLPLPIFRVENEELVFCESYVSIPEVYYLLLCGVSALFVPPLLGHNASVLLRKGPGRKERFYMRTPCARGMKTKYQLVKNASMQCKQPGRG